MVIVEAKVELQGLMERQIVVLRSILTNLHREHKVLSSPDGGDLEEIIQDRFSLFSSFEQLKSSFFQEIQKLSNSTENRDMGPFDEMLERLRQNLNSDDIELLLLSEQLKSLIVEIQRETTTILHFLEHKAFHNSPFYLPIPPVHHSQVVVGVVDEGAE